MRNTSRTTAHGPLAPVAPAPARGALRGGLGLRRGGRVRLRRAGPVGGRGRLSGDHRAHRLRRPAHHRGRLRLARFRLRLRVRLRRPVHDGRRLRHRRGAALPLLRPRRVLRAGGPAPGEQPGQRPLLEHRVQGRHGAEDARRLHRPLRDPAAGQADQGGRGRGLRRLPRLGRRLARGARSVLPRQGVGPAGHPARRVPEDVSARRHRRLHRRPGHVDRGAAAREYERSGDEARGRGPVRLRPRRRPGRRQEHRPRQQRDRRRLGRHV